MTNITMYIPVVSHPNPGYYLKQRVYTLHRAGTIEFDKSAPASSQDLLRLYVDYLETSARESYVIPHGDSIELSGLPDEKRKHFHKRKQCLIGEITDFFPLIDGEVIVKDHLVHLQEPWGIHHVNTLALRRITNFSESVYILQGVKVDYKNQEIVENQLVKKESEVQGVLKYNPDFGGAAKKLADGLVGAAPPPLNVIGAALITAFWPSAGDATSQWQQVYQALQTIVKNALAENNVNVAAAKLQGVVSFLDNEYVALKNTPGTTKEQLMTALQPYDTAFFLDIVNIFMHTNTEDQGLAAASLANFMTGACLHMALNQERALQDPNAPTPAESAYAQTVINLADTYGQYARNTAPYVKNLRMAQISEVQSSSESFCQGGPAGSCTTTYWFWFTDDNDGYRSSDYSYNSAQKDPPDVEGDAKAARDQYYNDRSAEIDADLQTQVFDVANQWDNLKNNPIPIIV